MLSKLFNEDVGACGRGTHQVKSWDRRDAIGFMLGCGTSDAILIKLYCTPASGETLDCKQAPLHGLRLP